jgi:hypothetical protein
MGHHHYILILLAASLLMAGCTGTAPAGNPNPAKPIAVENTSPKANTTPPAQPQQPVQTCDQYCQTQPHPSCVGAWNISGTYPSCSCGYVCPPQKNETAAPAEQLPPRITGTISERLADGMAKLSNEFYKKNDGSFTEKSYSWARIPVDTDINDITFNAAPASDVTFDSISVKSIVASGFIVFKNNDDQTLQTYGIAIFKDKRTILDDYTGTGMFSVDYFPPSIDKKLRDCTVYKKDDYSNAGGDWIASYSFVCWKTYDK